MKVSIIGAGMGGLASACQLAKSGYSVSVYEKNSTIGGRAMVFSAQGFTFDMGPSWYLMPDVFENFFKKFGKLPSDYYSLTRLSPNYRIFFGPKDYVDIQDKFEDNFPLFESLEPGSSKKIADYLRQSEYAYRIAMDNFLYTSFDNPLDFAHPKLMLEALRLNVFDSLENYISKFIKSDKLKKILLYSVVFLGGSPKNTPAIYNIMSHIDFNLGVWYPAGGMGQIPAALSTLAKSLGVKIYTNSNVEQITVENQRATGLVVNCKHISSDIVLSNADYPFTETKLLQKPYQSYPESYWSKKTIAPSAFILYLGVSKKIKSLEHHNLFFTSDWESHFDTIFSNRLVWPENPSYYVSCPSKIDSTVAPQGKENLFVLVPIASGLTDTPEIRQKYKEKILSDLELQIGEKFQDHIEYCRILTINDYASLYNAYKGTALGFAHSLFQSAIFRPKNKSSKVKNLYYTGQYTLPGIGVPMCLISGEISATRIQKEFPCQ